MAYRKLWCFCFILIGLVTQLYGGASFCSKQKTNSVAKTTLASIAEDNYDIKYLRFNLNLSDTTVYVAGDVSTTAQVVAATMSSYVFELDTTLNIDSAFINGYPVSVATTGSLRTIALTTALTSGTMFTARIFYQLFKNNPRIHLIRYELIIGL